MAQTVFETQSLCPYCLKRIPARYEEEDNQVYFYKECGEHGAFRVLFWRDARHYKKWMDQSVHAAKLENAGAVSAGCPFDCGLCAMHEGGMCTAVLEITNRCNLSCSVCFADAGEAGFEPSLETVREMYGTVLKNGGYCSVQLSGGEPTMRGDLDRIIRMGKDLGFPHIQVNTNGLKLAEDTAYARVLREAGADLVYLQFDGTRDDIYRKVRGRKLFCVKEKAVENCAKAGLGVLLVPTVIQGVNLDDIGGIIRFAKARMPAVKGIHFQPVSYFGRYPAVPGGNERISLYDVIREMEAQTGGEIRASHIVPRKRYDAHCAFSSLYYLSESGRLQAITEEEQNAVLNPGTDFAKKTNAFTNAHWRMAKAEKTQEQSRMAAFRARLRDYTLAVTGMGFADVWNIDIGRLKGCCVQVITRRMQAVPLCAFHLTGINGERLYKNG